MSFCRKSQSASPGIIGVKKEAEFDKACAAVWAPDFVDISGGNLRVFQHVSGFCDSIIPAGVNPSTDYDIKVWFIFLIPNISIVKSGRPRRAGRSRSAKCTSRRSGSALLYSYPEFLYSVFKLSDFVLMLLLLSSMLCTD